MSARALRGTHGIVPVWSSVETQYKTIHQIVCDRWGRKKKKKSMSEVGFEPTPTRVDCDLNAAP